MDNGLKNPRATKPAPPAGACTERSKARRDPVGRQKPVAFSQRRHEMSALAARHFASFPLKSLMGETLAVRPNSVVLIVNVASL